MSPMNATGDAFVRALAAKDAAALRAVLDPAVDFRAMTPGRVWEAGSADEVVDQVLLGTWFAAHDRIDRVVAVEHGQVGDRSRVGYRLDLSTPDGSFVVEQQAYYDVDGGRITWLRVLCSGFRPATG